MIVKISDRSKLILTVTAVVAIFLIVGITKWNSYSSSPSNNPTENELTGRVVDSSQFNCVKPGGRDYYNKGTATITINGRTWTEEDRCSTEDLLTEVWCNGYINTYDTYSCSDNRRRDSRCVDGKCTRQNSCRKTGGRDYNTKGHLTAFYNGVDISSDDYCKAANTLVELYCNGQNFAYEEHSCTCQNGVCVQAAQQGQAQQTVQASYQGRYQVMPYRNTNSFSIPVTQGPGVEPLPNWLIDFTIPSQANVPGDKIRVTVDFTGVPVANHPNHYIDGVMLIGSRSFGLMPSLNSFATRNIRNNEGDGIAVYEINKADLKFGANNANRLLFNSGRGDDNTRNEFRVRQVTIEGITQMTVTAFSASR